MGLVSCVGVYVSPCVMLHRSFQIRQDEVRGGLATWTVVFTASVEWRSPSPASLAPQIHYNFCWTLQRTGTYSGPTRNTQALRRSGQIFLCSCAELIIFTDHSHRLDCQM